MISHFTFTYAFFLAISLYSLSKYLSICLPCVYFSLILLLQVESVGLIFKLKQLHSVI